MLTPYQQLKRFDKSIEELVNYLAADYKLDSENIDVRSRIRQVGTVDCDIEPPPLTHCLNDGLVNTTGSKKNRVGNTKSGYIRYKVASDGNCGYTAFGITRQKAFTLLIEHLDEIKTILKPAILEQLSEEKFGTFLKERKAGDPTTPIHLQTEQHEGYAALPAVIRAFLAYDVSLGRIDAGWAHPLTLQALAHIQKIELHLWRLSPNQALQLHRGAGYDYAIYQPPGGSTQRTDLLFINGNHFERLELVNCENLPDEEPIYPLYSSRSHTTLQNASNASEENNTLLSMPQQTEQTLIAIFQLLLRTYDSWKTLESRRMSHINGDSIQEKLEQLAKTHATNSQAYQSSAEEITAWLKTLETRVDAPDQDAYSKALTQLNQVLGDYQPFTLSLVKSNAQDETFQTRCQRHIDSLETRIATLKGYQKDLATVQSNLSTALKVTGHNQHGWPILEMDKTRSEKVCQPLLDTLSKLFAQLLQFKIDTRPNRSSDFRWASFKNQQAYAFNTRDEKDLFQAHRFFKAFASEFSLHSDNLGVVTEDNHKDEKQSTKHNGKSLAEILNIIQTHMFHPNVTLIHPYYQLANLLFMHALSQPKTNINEEQLRSQLTNNHSIPDDILLTSQQHFYSHLQQKLRPLLKLKDQDCLYLRIANDLTEPLNFKNPETIPRRDLTVLQNNLVEQLKATHHILSTLTFSTLAHSLQQCISNLDHLIKSEEQRIQYIHVILKVQIDLDTSLLYTLYEAHKAIEKTIDYCYEHFNLQDIPDKTVEETKNPWFRSTNHKENVYLKLVLYEYLGINQLSSKTKQNKV